MLHDLAAELSRQNDEIEAYYLRAVAAMLMTKEELAAWIVAHGYTQRELASRLGIDKGTVSRWITGRTPVPPWVPVALAGLEGK